MPISSSIYKQILREYEKLRDESVKLLKIRQNTIYKKIPRIKQIDEELSTTSINITKAIINNPEKSKGLITKMEKHNNKLIDEKNQLLSTNGYYKGYLDTNYLCNKCKDTGYIVNKMCNCMKQKLIDKAYLHSNLKDVLKYENFGKFDLSLYSDIIDLKEGISAKENMELVKGACVKFCKEFDKVFKNLIFYGQSGLGKTFLCNCIAGEILDMGKTVIYITAFQLFKTVEEKRFDTTYEVQDNEYLNTILSVDLLIIDDLGTEFSTLLTSSELYNFINTRLLDKKSTIISTNLGPADWLDYYSDRIISRIQGNYILLKLIGEDIRVIKKYGNAGIK